MEGMKKYQIIYMKNGCAVTKWARTIEQVDKKMAKLSAAGYAPSVRLSPLKISVKSIVLSFLPRDGFDL